METIVVKNKNAEGDYVPEMDKYRARDSGDATGNMSGGSGVVIYDISAQAPTGSKIYPTRFRIRELANTAGIIYVYLGSVAAENLIDEFYLAGQEEIGVVYEGRGGSVDVVVRSGTSTDIFAGVDVMVDSKQRSTD